MVTFNAKRTARIPAAKLGQRGQSPPVILIVEPVDDPKPELLVFDVLQRFIKCNPVIELLINTLDLEVVYSTPIVPEIVPELPLRAYDPINPKLKAIAKQTFGPNTTYTENEAVTKLAISTSVSEERARKGLALMCAQHILDLTLSKEYYLSDSTPF